MLKSFNFVRGGRSLWNEKRLKLSRFSSVGSFISLIIYVLSLVPVFAQAVPVRIDKLATSEILKRAEKKIGQQIPQAEKIFYVNLLDIALVIRVEGKHYCLKDTCLTYVIDIRENKSKPNFTTLIVPSVFLISDESSRDFPGGAFLMFPTEHIEVLFTPDFVATHG